MPLADLLSNTHWLVDAPVRVIPGSTYFKVLQGLFVHEQAISSKALPDVTIATQYSLDSLHNVIDMAEASDIPISVSVLAQKKVGLSIELIKRFRSCFDAVASMVDFHLVLVDVKTRFYADIERSLKEPADLSTIIKPSEGAFDSFSCDQLRREGLAVIFGEGQNFKDKGIPYPHNLLRNIALEAITTKYAIVLDGDFVPSAGFGAACTRVFVDLESRGLNMSHLIVIAPGMSFCSQIPSLM
jgi:hypothetical protein